MPWGKIPWVKNITLKTIISIQNNYFGRCVQKVCFCVFVDNGSRPSVASFLRVNGIRTTGKFITFYVLVETKPIFVIIITATYEADSLHVQTSFMFTVIPIVWFIFVWYFGFENVNIGKTQCFFSLFSSVTVTKNMFAQKAEKCETTLSTFYYCKNYFINRSVGTVHRTKGTIYIHSYPT